MRFQEQLNSLLLIMFSFSPSHFPNNVAVAMLGLIQVALITNTNSQFLFPFIIVFSFLRRTKPKTLGT